MPVTMQNMIDRTNTEIVQILASEPAESRRLPARETYTHQRTNGGSWRSRLAQYEKNAKNNNDGVSSSDYFKSETVSW